MNPPPNPNPPTKTGEAGEENCGLKTFQDILNSSQSFFGAVVLRPDGAIAGMNPSLSKLLPPIRSADRQCYVLHCPTAVWSVSQPPSA